MTRPAPAPVVEIERHLHWRVIGIAGFLALTLTLAVLAAVSLLVPPERVAGLPDDPEVRSVAAALQDRLPLRGGGLRFRSALTGEAGLDARFGPAEARLAGQAAATLERVRERRRGDPRLEVALGHLELLLGNQRYLAAERRYRAVTDRRLDAPEARLGLGLALALQARVEPEPLRARALRLEALAQLVAVDRDAPVYAVALYDRALLLAALGSADAAGVAAREYLALDSSGPWAERLKRALARGAD